MTEIYQGDPYITLTPNGAELTFLGGQPVMDQGLENQATISLFTRQGWPGNFLLVDNQKVGSDFEVTSEKPITLNSLALLERSGENALRDDIFGNVRAVAINPKSYQHDVTITIEPPGSDPDTILLTKNGQNWINQAQNPAHKRI
jgi:hypothetical protein